MNSVYIVIEAESVDYHGTYHEIMGVFGNKLDAITKVKKLEDLNRDGDIEYYFEEYNVQ